MKLLAEEIRQDEHAARVRDYGEADAATYEERVKTGADFVRHLEPKPLPVYDTELERHVSELHRRWAAEKELTAGSQSRMDEVKRNGWMASLSIDDQSRKELGVELDRIKRDTYVDSEQQATGSTYTRGEGGYPFHELPVVERESLIEDYVDWGKYMERGLTFEDQGRVMYEAARDPYPRESQANQVTAPEQSSYERQLAQAAGAASDRGKDAGNGRER